MELAADPTTTAPALLLRPWRPSDAAALVELGRDEAMRRWTSAAVTDLAGARRWVREQMSGWESGDRLAFAVVETTTGAEGPRPAGHVVLKRGAPGSATAEVGYWTAAHARGRGVAPRAVETVTDWAFRAFAADGPARLRLLHQIDNTASCRVAHKCGYDLTAVLPAAPPDFPGAGHLHERQRPQ
ncbi:GNAT family N-acetyltransferase [Streptomyces brasiliensis]|uniref:Acetyltransferase n=1 Tax=Streptomyces brasiliensis TaxID=1954 RepID=A0A917L0W8_9ACTN|nr:GNAT family N-acetyltransferase [Streptomyces brasiliensis]GGJ39242.1 acetyltransferase [Streptomyces brasiliensis]